MKKRHFSEIFLSSLRSFLNIIPMLLGVILLIGLFEQLVTPQMLNALFSGNIVMDTLIGTIAGSISVGQPVAGYIIGGELLHSGVGFYAVAALIVSWVTIGIIQLPLEYSLFGRRFTVIRNALAFFFAIIVAIATVEIIKVI